MGTPTPHLWTERWNTDVPTGHGDLEAINWRADETGGCVRAFGSGSSCFYVLLTVEAIHREVGAAAPGGDKPDSACMLSMHAAECIAPQPPAQYF